MCTSLLDMLRGKMDSGLLNVIVNHVLGTEDTGRAAELDSDGDELVGTADAEVGRGRDVSGGCCTLFAIEDNGDRMVSLLSE